CQVPSRLPSRHPPAILLGDVDLIATLLTRVGAEVPSRWRAQVAADHACSRSRCAAWRAASGGAPPSERNAWTIPLETVIRPPAGPLVKGPLTSSTPPACAPTRGVSKIVCG